jgi:hypothetical protein
MKLSAESHPIWKTIDNSVMLAGLLIFLWLNSSNFDKTEIMTVIEMGGLWIAMQGAKKLVVDKGDDPP